MEIKFLVFSLISLFFLILVRKMPRIKKGEFEFLNLKWDNKIIFFKSGNLSKEELIALTKKVSEMSIFDDGLVRVSHFRKQVFFEEDRLENALKIFEYLFTQTNEGAKENFLKNFIKDIKKIQEYKQKITYGKSEVPREIYRGAGRVFNLIQKNTPKIIEFLNKK